MLPDKVCIVFTKCDKDDSNKTIIKSYRKELSHKFEKVFYAFEVSNVTELKDKIELELLKEWSKNNFDSEELKKAFFAAQLCHLDQKRKQALIPISIASASAAAVGASPVPFSDAALLVPIQTKLRAQLLYQFMVSI